MSCLPGMRKTAFSLSADNRTELGGDAAGSNSPCIDYVAGAVKGTVARFGGSRPRFSIDRFGPEPERLLWGERLSKRDPHSLRHSAVAYDRYHR